MSQILAVIKPHVAHVVTDTVATDPIEVKPCAFVDKMMILPRLNSIVVARGRSGFIPFLFTEQFTSWCYDFDELTDRARVLFTRTMVKLDKAGSSINDDLRQEALFVGYSQRRKRIEAHAVQFRNGGISHDVMGDGVIAAPWDWQKYGVLSPKLSDPEAGMAALSRRQFDTMRHHAFEDEQIMVGGEMVMATVKKSGVQTSLIGRFANHEALLRDITQGEDYCAERDFAAAFDCDAAPNVVN